MHNLICLKGKIYAHQYVLFPENMMIVFDCDLAFAANVSGYFQGYIDDVGKFHILRYIIIK